MARTGPTWLGLALAIFLVIQVVHSQNKCRTGCQGAGNQVFKYAPGTTYKYDYNSKIQITLSSAEAQQTGTEIKAKVLLTQQPDCNQVLRVEHLQIIGADGKDYKDIPDISKPIVLNFRDGQIEDHICTETDDTQNSLNVKRAVASLFQVNLKRTHETDVFGLCPTEVAQHYEGNSVVISKSRNLNKCAFREHIKQDYIATAFNLDSEIKSSPILDSSYNSKQKVKDGVLESAEVTEHYFFIPYSVGDKGAKAVVHSKLHLTGTGKDNIATKCTVPRSIIFENPHQVHNPKSNINTIIAAVKETVKSYDTTVSHDSANEFVNLVKVLRGNKKDDLLAVYNQVRAGAGFTNKVVAKKVFLDALLRSVSGDTIEVGIELLKNKELSIAEEKLVYLGFSFARHVSEGAIKSAATLLGQQKLPREAYLGVGALVNRYCREHSCEHAAAVHTIIQKLLAKLGDGKASNREDENDTIFTLKALANVHHLDDNVSAKIISIAQDKKQPNRLRVAALETYVSDPCKDKLRDSALSVLKDIQQDAEVRIKAYLAVAQCPNAKIGNAVKALLEHEPSNQVGGFIVSHIKNLRASANPDKQVARQHLGFLNLPSRFPVDFRRYSFNGEFSYTVDTLGIANSVESNVIYSQNSFLPRSTSLNLTAEVFGNTFNFLELEARQENLDQVFEHLFGPEGTFRLGNLQEIISTGERKFKDLKEKFIERLDQITRAKRDVSKAEIEQIKKQIQLKTTNLNKDLDLDLSLKIFGSELAFINWYDATNKFSPDAIIDKIIAQISQGFDKLQSFDEAFVCNNLWLDAELAYPTSLGFPLRLAVEGTSAVQVKATGSIDVRSWFNGIRPTIAKLTFIPSANVQIAGRLTLDALHVENGVKLKTSLYTATGGELTVDRFEDSKGFDIKFGLPLQKQTLVSANHEVVFHTREHAAREVNVPLKFKQNKDFTVCLDQFSPLIGLTFCADFNGPNVAGKEIPVLPYPLSGDAKLAITIDKDDVSAYHTRLQISDKPSNLGFVYLIESLGQNNNKKVSCELEAFMVPEAYVKFSLISPIKTVSAEGRIIGNANELAVTAKVQHENHEYYGKVGFIVTKNGQKAIYKPVFEYKTPRDGGVQISPYRLDGQIISERNPNGVKYVIDNLQIIAPSIRTITIAGFAGFESPAIYADLTVTNGAHSGSVKGRIQFSPESAKLNAEMQNTINPKYNFNLKTGFTLPKDRRSLDINFQLIHGHDLASKINMISFSSKTSSKAGNEFETKNEVSYPLHHLHVKVEYEQKPKLLDYEVKFELGKVKVGSELEAVLDKKVRGDYDIEFDIWGFNNKVELKAKRDEDEGQDSCTINNVLTVNGKTVELAGKLKHVIKPQDLNLGANLVLKIPTHSQPFNIDFIFILNAAQLDYSEKITSGGKVFYDAILKVSRDGNAQGYVKVDVPKILVINGQLKATKGQGNGDILIDVQAIKRSVKADATFAIAAPAYNVDFNVYPLYNDNPNRKLSISSHNQITEQNIDSQNHVDIFGETFGTNVKLQKQGEINNGKLEGEVEFILPNERYVLGKIHRDFKETDGVINLDGAVSLEHRKNKNAAGQKFNLKAIYRNVDFDKQHFDVEYNFAVDDAIGHTLNGDFILKRLPAGDKIASEIKAKVHGSVVKEPVEVALSANYKDCVGSYQGQASYGQAAVAEVKGVYDFNGQGGRYSGEVDFDVKTKSAALKAFKLALSGSAKEPQNPEDTAELDGTGSIFIDANTAQPIDIRTKGSVKASPKEGHISGTVHCNSHEPFGVSGTYKVSEQQPGFGNAQIEGSVSYGSKKWQINGEGVRSPKGSSADIKFQGLVGKQTEIAVKVARITEPVEQYKSDVAVTYDGRKWQFNGDVAVSEINPAVDVKFKGPDGKLTQVSAKVSKISENQFAGNLKIVDQRRNFLFEGGVDANVQNVEDFNIKINANSPAIHINKVVVDIHNKPVKTGRRINVNAKSDGKNLISGSTTYTTHEENGKLLVEGSGSFKVKEESKTANFKYIRQNLYKEKNGETGLEISFDAGLGNKAIDAELKITNKQFRYLNSYCEEKKECAHVEVDVKTNVHDVYNFNQELEVAIDLRKLGLSHEFGLKAVTNKKGLLLDHTVDVHFQSQEHNKYQYSIYVHPKQAGVSLTTPKRIISLEAVAEYPHTLLRGGVAKGEVAFYLDKKNQPNHKTSLSAIVDVNRQQNRITAQAGLSDPVLPRPLEVRAIVQRLPNVLAGVNVNVEIDVFSQPDKKIIISGESITEASKAGFKFKSDMELRSTGLNILLKNAEEAILTFSPGQAAYRCTVVYNFGAGNKESIAKFQFTPEEADILVQLDNVEAYKSYSKLVKQGPNHYAINSDMSGYGVKPSASILEIKNWNSVNFDIWRKENPANKLSLHAALIFGNVAEFSAKTSQGNLVHGSLKLGEADFLKTSYGINAENIKKLILTIRDDVITHLKELKNLAAQLADDVNQQLEYLKKIALQSPSLKPLLEYYIKEGEKIKEEILADKNISHLVELLQSILGVIVQSTSQAVAKFSQAVEEVAQVFHQIFGNLIATVQKDVIPKLKEIASEFIELGTQIFETVTDVVITIVAKIATILEGFKPEFDQIAAAVSEIGREVAKVVSKLYHDIKEVVVTNAKKIWADIKSMPITEEIKRYYKENIERYLPKGEALLFTFKDFMNTLKEIAPSPDLKVLITLISEYVEKKATNKPVDDALEIDRIIQTAIEAIRKIITAFLENGDLPELQNFELPEFRNVFAKLPRLAAIRFSPLTYILANDITPIYGFIVSFITHPRYWIPPFPLYGILVQGQHIFTFDGKHITFPGQCSYLLAGDAVHGHFTLVGTYAGGLLTEITLSDKANSVSYKKAGQSAYNHAPTELPHRSPDLSLGIYREYGTINLESDTGIKVTCTVDLEVCAVSVSGFYHGHLKGLLGNGNSEPYDDFVQANGKIVKEATPFANSYKVTQSCADVKAEDHKGHSTPVCNQLFGGDSELRLCYPFVHPENFKTACEHGVAAKVKDTEGAVAKGYVAACRQRGIPVSVPKHFLKCYNSEKPFNFGDTFSVKTPGKAADIVILVETVKYNEPIYKELVQPLVQQLSNELHGKGINDIDYHVIAYGGHDNQWPSHVTIGGKLQYKGKVPNLKFTEPKPERRLKATCPRLNSFLNIIQNIKHEVDLVIGNHLAAYTYREALAYPFRAHAIKTVVAVPARQCEVGSLLPLQIISALMYKNDEINLNVITPARILSVKDAKHTKDVAGFNDENIFFISQAKKNPEGSSELYKDLVFSDYCIDFTLKNKGNVFISDNFINAKPPQRKQYVQTATHNIAAQLVGLEKDLDCECEYHNAYAARNVCRVVSIKDKRSKKGAARK